MSNGTSVFLLAGVLLVACGAGAFLWRRFRNGAPWRGEALPPPAGPAGVLARLVIQAQPFDVLPGPEGEPLARCLPLEVSPSGLSCELLDSASASEVRPGRSVTCFFPPVTLASGKVNAFASEILAVALTADPPKILLKMPQELQALTRRRQTRKRVSDPRFVRVRLWASDFLTSHAYFPDATPDIWINAYDGRQAGGENAVTDISAGGLALQVRTALLPKDLATGSPVVLKCSFFQFRDKFFKPYWYAGVVKAVSAAGPHTRRIAIGFIAAGALDEQSPQGVRWTEIIQQAPTGGIA